MKAVHLVARHPAWSIVPGSLALVLACLVGCSSQVHKPAPPEAVDLKTTRELAESSYAAADWRTAAKHYARLVEHMPQDTGLWFRLANAYARAEQPDQAIAAYREVLVRDAAFSKAWFNMGIVQLRQAANSFLKMEVHVAAGDPLRAQASHAYAGILEILGEGGEPAVAAGGASDLPASAATGDLASGTNATAAAIPAAVPGAGPAGDPGETGSTGAAARVVPAAAREGVTGDAIGLPGH